MYIIATFARNRAENKTRPNSRRNPSGLYGQWETSPKPTSASPDGTRLFLLLVTGALPWKKLSNAGRASKVSLRVFITVRRAPTDRQSPLHYR